MPDPSSTATAIATTVASQQASQAALVSLLADPVDHALSLLDPADPSSFDKFLLLIKAITHHFGRASGTEAGRYYQAERKAAGIHGSISIKPVPTADPAKIEASARWATKDLWSPKPDLASVRSNTLGVVEKNVLDTGRMTIIDTAQSDRKATGWARETEPGACSFCAMLAIRGAVYKRDTVDFQAHSHCRCFSVPVFNQYEPSARVREWQQIYNESAKKAYGPKAARAAFRKAYDAHNAKSQ